MIAPVYFGKQTTPAPKQRAKGQEQQDPTHIFMLTSEMQKNKPAQSPPKPKPQAPAQSNYIYFPPYPEDEFDDEHTHPPLGCEPGTEESNPPCSMITKLIQTPIAWFFSLKDYLFPGKKPKP
jgi:hypothetical protein